MTALPVLGVLAPEFAQTVEAALRQEGKDALADQIFALPIVVQCACGQACSAFLSVPLDERGDGKVCTTFALHDAKMTVLVDHIDGLVVGLDVLDSSVLRRTIIENWPSASEVYFAKPL